MTELLRSSDGNAFPLLDDASLLSHLEQLGILDSTSGARLERVGDGNLNFLRRVRPRDTASFVVKQVRTAVDDAPGFALPADRILFERRYFALVEELVPGRSGNVPKVLYFDERSWLLVLEDLGDEPDLLDRLRTGTLPETPVHELGALLGEVHRETARIAPELIGRFPNHRMRDLHGHQLFSLPRDRDLDPQTAHRIDDELRRPGVTKAIASLRSDYFERRDALVHGDVKAANVLVRNGQVCLIDAEFAHIGDPAFDLGAGFAHCLMGLVDAAIEQQVAAERVLMAGYFAARGFDPDLRARAVRYAGLDIVYHVVGPARLSFLREPRIADRAIGLGIGMLLA